MAAERSSLILTALSALFAFLTIVLGALTKSFEAGLAFPDWPTSDGYFLWFFPLNEMVGGKFYEHSHRLLASGTGLFTLAMCLKSWCHPNRLTSTLWKIALLMVIVQGVLGGVGVWLKLPPVTSILHGSLAQLFFALLSALWLLTVTQQKWNSEAFTHRAFLILPAVAWVQMFLGALYRHTLEMPSLVAHLVGALLTMFFLIWAAIVALTEESQRKPPTWCAITLLTLFTVQIALGAGALVQRLKLPNKEAWTALAHEDFPTWMIVLSSSHLAVGALIMAVATCLALYTWQPSLKH